MVFRGSFPYAVLGSAYSMSVPLEEHLKVVLISELIEGSNAVGCLVNPGCLSGGVMLTVTGFFRG